ncbi:hypothetical protein CYMTET_48733 [Cymbomonas tetramitiformis]|uniref:Uncharacterized protein n=1 Tax=Cymbomonas tetramitiformis TaxID=36881 RepID=A0AAE0BTA7_9CHLO|nr:hypothetical protein CYMTET_48733 [Cymbomonas tetramitiformis]
MAKTAAAEYAKKKVEQTKKRKPPTLYDEGRTKRSKKCQQTRAIAQAQEGKKAKAAGKKLVKECFGSDSSESEEEEEDDDDEEEEEEEEEAAKAGPADQPLDFVKLMENPQQMAAIFAMMQKAQLGVKIEADPVARRPSGATDDEVSLMQADARTLISEWEEAKKLPVGACKEDLGKTFVKLKREIGKTHIPPCTDKQVHTYLVAHLSYRKARRGGTGRFKMNKDGVIRIYGGPLNGLTVENFTGLKVPNADIIKKLDNFTDPAARKGKEWTTLEELVGGTIVWPEVDEEDQEDEDGKGKEKAAEEAPKGGEEFEGEAGEASRDFELHCPVGLFAQTQQSSEKLDEKETANFEQRSKFELAVGVVEALPGTLSQTFTDPPMKVPDGVYEICLLGNRMPTKADGGSPAIKSFIMTSLLKLHVKKDSAVNAADFAHTEESVGKPKSVLWVEGRHLRHSHKASEVVALKQKKIKEASLKANEKKDEEEEDEATEAEPA